MFDVVMAYGTAAGEVIRRLSVGTSKSNTPVAHTLAKSTVVLAATPDTLMGAVVNTWSTPAELRRMSLE